MNSDSLQHSTDPVGEVQGIIRRRRPRYSGTHPKKFHEKYKELRSDLFPELTAKIEQRGKTVAGTHRPICVAEVLDFLKPKVGETGVDATIGYGGHAKSVLERIVPSGLLVGLDTDGTEIQKTQQRLRQQGFGDDNLKLVQSNYAGIIGVIHRLGIARVNFVLADLGCSSMQLDDPERGFTFKRNGPLDMRMNRSKGPPASEWLASVSEQRLREALVSNADEPDAERIAAGLVKLRKQSPILTTHDLRDAIRSLDSESFKSGGAKQDSHLPNSTETRIRRVFQAVRIAVNDEFSALGVFLRSLPEVLAPEGRVVILTFHSGEDRRVKHAFKEGFNSGVYSAISDEVIRPTAEEVRSNTRAAPAKLRWAVRVP